MAHYRDLPELRPVDSYLDLLKPKPKVYLTNQQVYDRTITATVKQKVQGVIFEDPETGGEYPVTFSNNRYAAPLLLLDYRDIRALQKKDYERLKYLTPTRLEACWTTGIYGEPDIGDKELCAELAHLLDVRGVSASSLILIARMHQVTHSFAKWCISHNMKGDLSTTEWSRRYQLSENFRELGRMFDLNTSACQFTEP